MSIPGLQALPEPALIAIIAGSLYVIWRVCRLVVAWGYFIMFFVAGAGASWLYMPQAPQGTAIAIGLAFATAVSAIRAKIMKVIMGAAVIGAGAVVGPMLQKEKDKLPEPKPKPAHSQKQQKPK